MRFNRRPSARIPSNKSYIREEVKSRNWHKYTFNISLFTKTLNVLGKHKYRWAINVACDNWYRIGDTICTRFDPINDVFCWIRTPEGMLFWDKIHDKYLECV